MASKHFEGYLVEPLGDDADNDKLRFTHSVTTGNTLAGAQSIITIGSDGFYSFDLEYGIILIEYFNENSRRWIIEGSVTVNSDTVATDLPSLLGAVTPATPELVLQLEAILADANAAADNAEQSATDAANSAVENGKVIRAILVSEGLSGEYGYFADGFTVNDPLDVGIDASFQFWKYVGTSPLPYTVTVGTIPSAPDYEQINFKKDYTLNFVTDLINADQSLTFNCKSHSSGNGGVGGTYIFKQGAEKSIHDGVKFVSPTVPYTNLSDYLKGVGETDPSGNGVWECVTLPAKKPTVSFVIDDGIANQYDLVPPIFEAFGKRCAFAILPALTKEGSTRLSKSEVQDLDSRGYEIIAHSNTDLRTTTSKALSSAEIDTAYQAITQYAKVNGYLASQSQLSDTAIEAGKKHFDYLYSVTAAQAIGDIENALFTPDNHYNLSRVNIDGANSILGIPAVQKAAINYKNVTLYEHLYTDTTALNAILTEIVQYNAVTVGLPRESFSDSLAFTQPVNQRSIKIDTTLFTSSAGSINTSSGSLPIAGDSLFFSPTSTGANKVLQFEQNVEADTTQTFSFNAVSSSGTYDISVGIHFLDAGDSIVSENSVETDDVESLDDNDFRRYYVSASAPVNAVKIRCFIRINVITNGTITLKQPRLSKSMALLPTVNVSEVSWLKSNLPTQDINIGRAGASLPNVQLALPTIDSVYYSISSNEVTFKKDGIYSVNIYASGTSPSVTTGVVFASLPNQNASSRGIGVLSGNGTLAHFSASTNLSVKAGDTMTVNIRAKSDQATDQNMSISFGGLSAIEIQKII